MSTTNMFSKDTQNWQGWENQPCHWDNSYSHQELENQQQNYKASAHQSEINYYEQSATVFEQGNDNLPVWREPTETGAEAGAATYEEAEQLAGQKRTFEEENKGKYEQQMSEQIDYLGNPEAAMADLKRIKRAAEDNQIECEPPNEETIRLMWDTGCILFGRGKPFEDKLKTLLNESELMDWENKKELNDNGHPLPPNLHPSVREKVETLKTEQIFAFIIHFQDMPPGVKLTFTRLNDNFPELLNKIIGGFDHTMSFGLALTTMWYDLVSYHLMNR